MHVRLGIFRWRRRSLALSKFALRVNHVFCLVLVPLVALFLLTRPELISDLTSRRGEPIASTDRINQSKIHFFKLDVQLWHR